VRSGHRRGPRPVRARTARERARAFVRRYRARHGTSSPRCSSWTPRAPPARAPPARRACGEGDAQERDARAWGACAAASPLWRSAISPPSDFGLSSPPPFPYELDTSRPSFPYELDTSRPSFHRSFSTRRSRCRGRPYTHAFRAPAPLLRRQETCDVGARPGAPLDSGAPTPPRESTPPSVPSPYTSPYRMRPGRSASCAREERMPVGSRQRGVRRGTWQVCAQMLTLGECRGWRRTLAWGASTSPKSGFAFSPRDRAALSIACFFSFACFFRSQTTGPSLSVAAAVLEPPARGMDGAARRCGCCV